MQFDFPLFELSILTLFVFQTSAQHPSAQTSVIQSTKHYQSPVDEQNHQNDFNNDNQDFSMYGDEMREQNSLNSFKKSAESNSDFIESYHDNSSEDVDMDGNNIGLKITD